MAEAKLYGQSKGGIDIRGIIKEYYASAKENIKAGDLVEFVNEIADSKSYGTSVDTKISTGKTNGSTRVSAIALDDNRVFMTYGADSNAYLYSIVATIVDNTTIVLGAETILSSDKYSGMYTSLVKLNGNRVFIAHSYGTSYSLYAMIVEIDGTTITKKVTKSSLIPSSSGMGGYEGLGHTAIPLPDGKIAIAHSRSSSRYLNISIITIDGDTISTSSTTAVSTIDYSCYNNVKACLVSDARIFTAQTYGSSQYLYCSVSRIDGITVTCGTPVSMSSTTHTGSNISICPLPEGKVFIAHSYSSSYYLYGMIVSTDLLTLVSGVDTVISTENNCGSAISANLVSDYKVLVTHPQSSVNSNYHLCGVVCSVDGPVVVGTETAMYIPSASTYTGCWLNSILLNNNTLFVAHSYSSSYYLYAQIWSVDLVSEVPTSDILVTDYETQVRGLTTRNCMGIAKSSTPGREVTKTGNIFPTKDWVEVSKGIEYTSNGYRITADNCHGIGATVPDAVKNAFDNSMESPSWTSATGTTSWIKIELPEAIKITKMRTHFNAVSEDYISSAKIQGSKNNSQWVDLASITHYQNSLESVELTNTDFYKYYRMYITLTTSSRAFVYEWQTSEYVTSDSVSDLVEVYRPYYTFNLIPDGSFENDVWISRNDTGNIQISSRQSYNGQKSLYFPIGQTIVPEIPIARPILGHKYYGRRYIKTNGDNQPADCRFEMYGGDGEGKNWVFAWNNGNHPNWDFESAIHEITAINYPETVQTIIRCFNVNTTAETWVDDLLLLDLTDLFGQGNEPTKEWCDANI